MRKEKKTIAKVKLKTKKYIDRVKVAVDDGWLLKITYLSRHL
ncbi:MAG: hypothetical protein QXF61_08590 [Nitrososphaeria archaeon]